MAKVTMNPVVRFIQGKMGDVVFKRKGDGVIMSRKAVSKQPPSKAQLAQRKKFKEATLYGRLVSADPVRKVDYFERSQGLQKPMFSLMIRDFMNAPVVEFVDVSQFTGKVGDEIVALADDDFGVVAVTVQVLGENDRLLLEGEAVEEPAGSRRWVYGVETAVEGAVSVVVKAKDRPGNVGEGIVNC